MTLYACRSSSHKTRYAIFVGALKLSHKAFAAQNLCGSPERQESAFSPLTQGGLRRGRKSGNYSLSLISGVRVEWHDTVSRGRDRASPLPTHLLRICAGALKRRARCAVSKFASGKEPTGLFARKHLLASYTGEASDKAPIIKKKDPWGHGSFALIVLLGCPELRRAR